MPAWRVQAGHLPLTSRTKSGQSLHLYFVLQQEGQGGLHTFPTCPLELLQYQGCCQLSGGHAPDQFRADFSANLSLKIPWNLTFSPATYQKPCWSLPQNFYILRQYYWKAATEKFESCAHISLQLNGISFELKSHCPECLCWSPLSLIHWFSSWKWCKGFCELEPQNAFVRSTTVP